MRGLGRRRATGRTAGPGPALARPSALCVLLATIGALLVPAAARASSMSIQHFTATVSDTNKITLDWQVSGGDSSGMLYIFGLGARPQACPARQAVGCSASLRVPRGGVFRFTLSLHNDAMQELNSTIETFVRPLAPPTTPAPRIHVDMLDIRPQTLSWTHAGAGFVEVTPPDSPLPFTTRFAPAGSYTVPASSLPTGRSTF